MAVDCSVSAQTERNCRVGKWRLIVQFVPCFINFKFGVLLFVFYAVLDFQFGVCSFVVTLPVEFVMGHSSSILVSIISRSKEQCYGYKSSGTDVSLTV